MPTAHPLSGLTSYHLLSPANAEQHQHNPCQYVRGSCDHAGHSCVAGPCRPSFPLQSPPTLPGFHQGEVAVVPFVPATPGERAIITTGDCRGFWSEPRVTPGIRAQLSTRIKKLSKLKMHAAPKVWTDVPSSCENNMCYTLCFLSGPRRHSV